MYFMAIFVMAMLIAIDRITKIITVKYLMPISSATLIDNFFKLTYVENTGAAFGILQGAKWLFVVIAIVLVVCGAMYYRRLVLSSGSRLLMAALLLIGAGAVGNIIDRLVYGYVVDMLDFYIFGYNFPVFNFADICVCVGVGLMILDFILADKKA